MNLSQKIGEFFKKRKLMTGVILAVTMALALTLVSMTIYVLSDVARLDISRPGYEKLRESVIKNETTDKFEANGLLDKQSVQDFQEIFREKRRLLEPIGRFDGNPLGDEELKLTPVQ